MHALDPKASVLFGIFLVVSVAEVWVYQFVGPFPSHFYRLIGDRNESEIWDRIIQTCAVCAAAALLLSLKTWVADHLAILFRVNLGHRLQDRYIDSGVFCSMRSAADHSIDNQDSRITQDVSDWSSFASAVISKLIQTPVVVAYYSFLAWRSLTLWGYLLVLGFSGLSLLASRLAMQRVMAQRHAYERAQSDFRHVHALVAENAETICASRAQAHEERSLNRRFGAAVAQQLGLANLNVAQNFTTMGFAYASGVVPFLIMRAFHWAQFPTESSECAAFCSATAFVVMSLSNGLTASTMIAADIAQLGQLSCRVRELWNYLFAERVASHCADTGDRIAFAGVTVLAPVRCEGAAAEPVVLIQGLSFTVREGQSLFVTGPSGLGKSTLVKAIGRIWPYTRGAFSAPPLGPADMMILAREPYMPRGGVRACLAFPRDERDVSADDMRDALEFMRLGHLLTRDPADWSQGLSQGELQRVALVRPWIHRPRFLVLDEATNAIPEAMEAAYIARMIGMGITVVTIAHHLSMRGLHEFSLDFEDGARYRFYRNARE